MPSMLGLDETFIETKSVPAPTKAKLSKAISASLRKAKPNQTIHGQKY